MPILKTLLENMNSTLGNPHTTLDVSAIQAAAARVRAEWQAEPKQEDKEPPEPESILDEAAIITSGERRRDYDKATINHNRIAGAWNWFLSSRPDPEAGLSAADVAHMMILLKVARNVRTPKRDNIVDMAGYAKCLSQIQGFEQE